MTNDQIPMTNRRVSVGHWSLGFGHLQNISPQKVMLNAVWAISPQPPVFMVIGESEWHMNKWKVVANREQGGSCAPGQRSWRRKTFTSTRAEKEGVVKAKIEC